jgi:hypothetical protein
MCFIYVGEFERAFYVSAVFIARHKYSTVDNLNA